jgi:NAD dependent epimerase/dehydratase family enzyme
MKNVSTRSHGRIDGPPYRHAYFMDNHRWLSGENLFISRFGSAQIQDLQDSRFTLTDRLVLARLSASMALDRTCCNEVVRL